MKRRPIKMRVFQLASILGLDQYALAKYGKKKGWWTSHLSLAFKEATNRGLPEEHLFGIVFGHLTNMDPANVGILYCLFESGDWNKAQAFIKRLSNPDLWEHTNKEKLKIVKLNKGVKNGNTIK